MRIFHIEILESDYQLFRRPGLDLVSGQVVELDTEPAPAQLDLFSEQLNGHYLPLSTILQSLAGRYQRDGERDRARAFLCAADAVDELPSGHPMFRKLAEASAVGGPAWGQALADFLEGWGSGADLGTLRFWATIFAVELERELDEFLAQASA
jgi:hypothetical protein